MYDDEQIRLKQLLKKTNTIIKSIDIPAQKILLENFEKERINPNFYKDIQKSTEVNKKIREIENKILPWIKLSKELEDLEILIELSLEENDKDSLSEIQNTLTSLEENYKKLELLQFFQNEKDICNTFLSFQPGAGGTESCDWAIMLFRMYIKWIEKRNFNYEVIEFQSGDEAGLKSATIHVKGDYAHGYLTSEIGVHRLVRISPFDSQKRRHTSFCSIYATPEIEDNVKIEINSNDLRLDTYRSSGAGGQHVNTTDSAVRITHIPTNIVVTCQAERSQIQNKDKAMKVLKSKLYEHYKKEQEEKNSSEQTQKKKIEWGSQIRSYVFHPYNMVKDHRTSFEVGDAQSIVDGELDQFIESWLRFK